MSRRITKRIVFFAVLIIVSGCTKQQARRPIHQSETQQFENSVQANQLQLARETEIIEQWVIAQDNIFSSTPFGTYYHFVNPKNRPIVDPEKINKLYMRLERLDGSEIYDWSVIENPSKNQNVLSGVVRGLNFTPIGVETIMAMTSFLAYGSTGDGKLIGPYTPIVARIYIPLNQNK
jgi:hypothetical protein